MSKKSSNVEEIYNYVRNFHPALVLEALEKVPEKKVYEPTKGLKPPQRSNTQTITFDKDTSFEVIVENFKDLKIENGASIRLNYEVLGERRITEDNSTWDEEEDVYEYTVPIYGDKCISVELKFNVLNPKHSAELSEYNHKLKSDEDRKLNVKKHNERREMIIEENKRKVNSVIKNHREIWIACAKAYSNEGSPKLMMDDYVDSRILILEAEMERLKALKTAT
jgi:hypothetical protein